MATKYLCGHPGHGPQNPQDLTQQVHVEAAGAGRVHVFSRRLRHDARPAGVVESGAPSSPQVPSFSATDWVDLALMIYSFTALFLAFQATLLDSKEAIFVILVLAVFVTIPWYFWPEATTASPASQQFVITCPTALEGVSHDVVASWLPTTDGDVVAPLVGTFAARLEQIAADHLQPPASLTRIDTQAKWILGAHGTFVLLIGGLVWSGDALENLVLDNSLVFGIAVFTVALSFALAVASMTAGRFGLVNPNDLNEVQAGFNRLLGVRGDLVRGATVLFALSLVLAVAVPLAEVELRRPAFAVSHSEWSTDQVSHSTTLTFLVTNDRPSTLYSTIVWGEKVAGAAHEVLYHAAGLRPGMNGEIAIEVRVSSDDYSWLLATIWPSADVSPDCPGSRSSGLVGGCVAILLPPVPRT